MLQEARKRARRQRADLSTVRKGAEGEAMSLTEEQRESLPEELRAIVDGLAPVHVDDDATLYARPVAHGVSLLAARLCEAREFIERLQTRIKDQERVAVRKFDQLRICQETVRAGIARSEAAERDAKTQYELREQWRRSYVEAQQAREDAERELAAAREQGEAERLRQMARKGSVVGALEIKIDMDQRCARCRELGATQSGLCLKCVTKDVEERIARRAE